ncbi:hypothetical protein JCM4814A_22270 [Streptomyces phaeofaciens JCM 4814]|uniref:Integral membrane protein n=1 Tax=Streptomyces phaeofaciens TaxID=68254 RepID=A0A918LQF5_9ACTN|nr:hypothetical protein [Streptomyces phaeofaciens]GGT34114.1 hypothetical protein GCM10010226_07620 [Streptomyces phaeofaciens]
MPDRSLRLHTLPPQHLPGGERGTLLLRERPGSPPDAPQDDNPFAPPPEGTPDSPWRPRHPSGAGGSPEGQEGQGGQGPQGTPGAQGGGHSPWGSQWSDQQPGRAPGGFGERPGPGPSGPGPEGGGPGGQGPTPRWDPTDPAQRKGRYALLCGMWAFFFALFGWPYVALLLGALALNWGIGSLRAKPRTPDPTAPAPAEPTGRPQTTAAISGLVTASLALALVAVTFTAQLVYRDYYTCTSDALTNEAKQSCNDLLPKELKGILGANS